MPVHSDYKSRFVAVMLLSFCTISSDATAQVTDELPPPGADPAAYQKAQKERTRAVQRINNPLVTPQMQADAVKNDQTFRRILANGVQGQSQEQILNDGVKYMIYNLTDTEKTAQQMERDFGTIVGRLGRAGSGILNTNAKKRFREQLCGSIATHVQPLLTNNFNARSQALELLLSLEVVQPRGGVRIEMNDQVHQTYINVLSDPAQPDTVKARAANCAKKYFVKAGAIPQFEMALAEAIARELRRPETEVAYQDTLVAALEQVRTPRQLVPPGQPLHICVAVEVMQDRRRDILVRSRCARVLGRGGADNQINFDPLAWAVAELTLEVGFRQAQADDRSSPTWQRSGWYLYTAFHHENRRDLASGFLNRSPRSELVSGAYAACVPVMAHVMFNDSATPARMLGAVDNWLENNAPSDKNFDRTCPPIQTGS